MRGAAYARAMSEGHRQLAAIAEQVARAEQPRETVRALLGWFGYMRRGVTVVREIRRTLSRFDLQTVPDFALCIDAPIRFVAISKTVSPEDEAEDSSPALIPEAAPAHGPRQELAYEVGRLQAANKQRLVTVNPDDTLEKAVAVMLSEWPTSLPDPAGRVLRRGRSPPRSMGLFAAGALAGLALVALALGGGLVAGDGLASVGLRPMGEHGVDVDLSTVHALEIALDVVVGGNP